MKSVPHSEPVRQDLVVPKTRRGLNNRRLLYTVNSEVKAWLAESVKGHWYLSAPDNYGRLRISFHDHNDAMMFKLAWS